LISLCDEHNLTLVCPPAQLCSDNAAMIGWAAIERLQMSPESDSLEIAYKPRWILDKRRRSEQENDDDKEII
jgi:N6-L-threonylcarbamoyladenine synthase